MLSEPPLLAETFHCIASFWCNACFISVVRCVGPAAQQVGFRAFGGITSQDPIGARHALALTVLAARKVIVTKYES